MGSPFSDPKDVSVNFGPQVNRSLRNSDSLLDQLSSPPQSTSRSTHHSSLITHHSRRIPFEGWAWLTITVILLVTGLYKGINLLSFLGMAMAVTWLIHFIWAGRGLRYLKLRCWTNGWVFAQTPFTSTIEIANGGRRRQFGLALEDQKAGQVKFWFIPKLERGVKIQLQAELVIERRGIYAGQPLTIRSGYPFGLVERRLGEFHDEEFVVYPRVGRIHRNLLRRMLIHSGPSVGQARTNPRRHPAAQSDFHGLRAFRSGDSPHWIHWRTSARLGELMVREFEETPNDNLVVILDPWLPGVRNAESGVRNQEKNPAELSSPIPHSDAAVGVSHDPGAPQSNMAQQRLEDAISMAATICREWCQETGNRLVLGVADKEPLVMHGDSGNDLCRWMLRALAGVTGHSEPDVVQLVASMRPILPPGPILVLTTSPGNLQATLEREFHRPVTCIHVAGLDKFDFFEWQK